MVIPNKDKLSFTAENRDWKKNQALNNCNRNYYKAIPQILTAMNLN